MLGFVNQTCFLAVRTNVNPVNAKVQNR